MLSEPASALFIKTKLRFATRRSNELEKISTYVIIGSWNAVLATVACMPTVHLVCTVLIVENGYIIIIIILLLLLVDFV